MFLIRALPVTQTMRFEAIAQHSLPCSGETLIDPVRPCPVWVCGHR